MTAVREIGPLRTPMLLPAMPYDHRREADIRPEAREDLVYGAAGARQQGRRQRQTEALQSPAQFLSPALQPAAQHRQRPAEPFGCFHLRPIFEILPAQMLSLALAANKGIEAGRFMRASKVTAVE